MVMDTIKNLVTQADWKKIKLLAGDCWLTPFNDNFSRDGIIYW